MMATPLVSIITPCYNGESYLERYFNSVLNQTYSNLELIFINDGSIDRTEEIALSYQNIFEQKGIRYVYLYQENAGQAAALNRGLKLFNGKYLTWPDADDEMSSDCIEKKVTFLETHPELQMVRSNGFYVNKDTGVKVRIADNKKVSKTPTDIFEDLLLVKTYGCNGCYMITRMLLLECYPDRDIYESRVGQNWQLLVPAASRSLCGYIDENLYIIYEHGDSHSRKERSTVQLYQRWSEFTDVLCRALMVSKCDVKRYSRLVYWNKARQMFYIAVSVRDCKMLKRTIRDMASNGHVSLREWFLFIKCILICSVKCIH